MTIAKEKKKIFDRDNIELVKASEKAGAAFVKNLNANAIKSSERHKRWERIYEIEKSKWPQNMGNTMRSDIPIELHDLLDKCITKSQEIARNHCQTEELTQEYLNNNKYE